MHGEPDHCSKTWLPFFFIQSLGPLSLEICVPRVPPSLGATGLKILIPLATLPSFLTAGQAHGSDVVGDCAKATSYLPIYLSFYLFIVVAATNHSGLQLWNSLPPHFQNLSYPVLQYAEDTLIVLQPNADQLQSLKDLLLQFSGATGLAINVQKSTFAPIHVDDDLSKNIVDILGCPVATFPQSYLTWGSLSLQKKTNLSNLFFIIDKVDRRLADWRGLMLSLAGRAILVRVVLQALPIYVMSALLLPAGTLQEIDKHCRAFLGWAGKNFWWTV